MNYETSKVLNFTALKNMTLEYAPPVRIHNPLKMKRKDGGIVVSETVTKECNVVFEKRRFMNSFDFVSCGYR